ncbi:MAG: ABC transporter permease [Tissierellales bacterium]|jgi:tungstate transport system permease protein|nr:ABC transporter permease [Tissierellales bacterium]
MTYIIEGIKEAISLLSSLDAEIYGIVGLSIFVSFVSTMIASCIGLGLGIVMGLYDFVTKRFWVRFTYAFMASPPVVVGLFVALIISRRGPLGSLELMFTPVAMIAAQTLLVTPIITGLVYNATQKYGHQIYEICTVLGGSKKDCFFLVIRELRSTFAVAITTGFGRAISEVGAVMIVGGNIKDHTRVMTTFIAMNNSMGNYSKSIAMGLVLIIIAIITNGLIHRLSEGKNES